jgi:dihydrofolate reductase
MAVTAIAAIGKNRELGKGNELLWRIPDDLKRFRDLSRGHPVIMGRKTFDSIIAALGKPLPGRTSVVVTRDAGWTYPGVVTAVSIEDALKKANEAPGADDIIIAGGAQIYELALPFTDKLSLTLIDDTKDADTFFPPYEHEFTVKTFEEQREWEGLGYRWVDVERA